MLILGIETSCDDTCISIIRASGRKKLFFDILSNIVSSQVRIHQKWGGVYPMMAKREHQKNLVPVLQKALKKAGMLKNPKSRIPNPSPAQILPKAKLVAGRQIPNSKFQILKEILSREEYLCKKLELFLKKYQEPKIDLISVTVGPGLEPCLWTGVNLAKALSYYWDIPIIPVNHVEAHIFANFIKKQRTENREQIFPAICLVVSGGHTQLILMKDFGKYKILGETRDDAAGECFDKIAKILGLEYPGGPAIAAEAAKIPNSKPSTRAELGAGLVPHRPAESGTGAGFQIPNKLPRPMINQKNYDFSFSGLKTAVLYNFKNQPSKLRKNKQYIKEMCYETQQAIIDVLIKKTIKAAKGFKAKTIILGGGVASNDELRKQFREKIKKELTNIQYLIPNIQLCTDNAVMIVIEGYYRWLREKTKDWRKVEADANLRIK